MLVILCIYTTIGYVEIRLLTEHNYILIHLLEYSFNKTNSK